jgi:hypothetical protein
MPEREINAAQGIEAANCTLEEKARGVRRSFLIRAHMMKAKIEERERRKIILNCHVPTGRRDWNRSSRSSRAGEHSSIPQVSADGSRHKSGA